VSFCEISVSSTLLSAAEPFITKDKSFEKQRKCSLSSSLARAKSGPPLLQDKQFFITPNVQPAPSDMSDIIKCAGGQVGGFSSGSCDTHCYSHRY